MLNKLMKTTAVALMLAFAGTTLLADTAAEIKTRMKQRLSKIDSFKDQGVLGENNQGYLEARSKNEDAEKVAKEENDDRKKVYEAIGKKNNSTAENVGKLRAEKIAERSAKGHWIQDKEGNWSQKK